MTVTSFDTLKYATSLKKAGVAPEQAEAQAIALAEVLQTNLKDLVTKDDLKSALAELRTDLKNDMGSLRTELKNDMGSLRTELKNDMASLRTELKNEIGSLRTELKNDIALLRTESSHQLRESEQRQSSDSKLIKWMIGFLIPVCVAVAVRMFFFPRY